MYRAHGLRPARPAPTRAAAAANYLKYKPKGLNPFKRASIYRFIELGWCPRAIADKEGVDDATVYRIISNIKELGTSTKSPQFWKGLGRPAKISDDDADALFDELVQHGWMYQDEIIHWLYIERGVLVHQSTVSRFMKKKGWNCQTLRPFSINQNEELREAYRRRMHNYAMDDLIFLDESIFNEKTGWRHHAYGPIGSVGRYTQDISRGKTWAILPAYTMDGYLPCTGIKQGYYSSEDFIDWIRRHLLPIIREQYGDNRTMVIVLDNVFIHINHQVEAILREAGHLTVYLPPYSPDYNPIELTFSVLKSWIRRNYVYMRKDYQNFGEFLADAVYKS
jgi:transposase